MNCLIVSIQVTGSANEDQILESLVRYPKRVRCTQISLFDLFSLTQEFNEPRVNVIQVSSLFSPFPQWICLIRSLITMYDSADSASHAPTSIGISHSDSRHSLPVQSHQRRNWSENSPAHSQGCRRLHTSCHGKFPQQLAGTASAISVKTG